MRRILELFSFTVVILFALSIFGWTVHQIGAKNKKFGALTEPIKYMYSFPDLFKRSVEEVKSLPKTFVKTPNGFEPINRLEKDLIVLITHAENNSSRTVKVVNLRNDSVLNSWSIENPWDEASRIVNPILLDDGSLLYNYAYKAKPGLVRLGADGEILWTNSELVLHHGMNLNNEGDLWACTKSLPKASGRFSLNDKEVFYNDYRITKFDIESGAIVFDKSITELFTENDLGNYLFKSTSAKDPWHLNDVQPALETTKYYNEDDVFISIRNCSAILHYRPATNELIEVIEGPFVNQHDVDILNDSSIVLHNNNTFVDTRIHGFKPMKVNIPKAENAGDYYSNIVQYSLSDHSFSFPADSLFKANKIYTKTEGLIEKLDDQFFFVEEQNTGILWVLSENEVLYKNVLNSQNKGYHHLPNWTRVVSYN